MDLSLCMLLALVCPNGDFGRVRSSLVTDNIHAWVGRDAARDQGAPVSLFPLTDDELRLRDFAYPMIEPPFDRQRWFSVLGEWGVTRFLRPEWYNCDPTAYAGRLMTTFVRSESTRYARLVEDVRNDLARLDPFFMTARRVLDMDAKREQSLGYVNVLSGPEIANAQARVLENRLVIGWVQRSLTDRIASYRFALERLVIAVPSPLAVEADRSIAMLQTRVTDGSLVPMPNFPGAVAAAAVPLPPQRRAVGK